MERNVHIFNFACLFTKNYIYRQRCLQSPLVYHQWHAEFKKVEQIEKYIAVKNGKTERHNKKWQQTVANEGQISIEQYIQNYLQSK